jgi:hypothetical protein
LLHLKLGVCQPWIHFKSGVEVNLAHRYNAGVVYRNDSDIGTAVAGSLARTSEVLKARKSIENVTSRSIL